MNIKKLDIDAKAKLEHKNKQINGVVEEDAKEPLELLNLEKSNPSKLFKIIVATFDLHDDPYQYFYFGATRHVKGNKNIIHGIHKLVMSSSVKTTRK